MAPPPPSVPRRASRLLVIEAPPEFESWLAPRYTNGGPIQWCLHRQRRQLTQLSILIHCDRPAAELRRSSTLPAGSVSPAPFRRHQLLSPSPTAPTIRRFDMSSHYVGRVARRRRNYETNLPLEADNKQVSRLNLVRIQTKAKFSTGHLLKMQTGMILLEKNWLAPINYVIVI